MCQCVCARGEVNGMPHTTARLTQHCQPCAAAALLPDKGPSVDGGGFDISRVAVRGSVAVRKKFLKSAIATMRTAVAPQD